MSNATEKRNKKRERESESDDSVGGGRYAKGEIEIPDDAGGVDLRESDHAHDWMRREPGEEQQTPFSEMDDDELEEFEKQLDRMLEDEDDS